MGEIAVIGSLFKTALAKVNTNEDADMCTAIQKKGITETSIFEGCPRVTSEDIVKLSINLNAMFPDMNQIAISELCNTILAEGWTRERLAYAYSEIKKLQFKSFPIGKFLGIDKKITLGKSPEHLKYKMKYDVNYTDIVMVKIPHDYIDNDGSRKQDYIRAYAYKWEAQDVMPDNIIAEVDTKQNCYVYFGEPFYNHEVDEQRKQFKLDLCKYLNMPPKYNGIYPLEIVQSFFSYYGEILQPGDRLRYQSFMNGDFNIESCLERWAKNKFNFNQNNN